MDGGDDAVGGDRHWDYVNGHAAGGEERDAEEFAAPVVFGCGVELVAAVGPDEGGG